MPSGRPRVRMTAASVVQVRAESSRRVLELGIAFHGQEEAERYVSDHLDLLCDRPTVLRHGDYHPSNLIVQDEDVTGVVDFNRCDWGDPWEEFYKIAFFGAPVSENYACGQLFGYFGGSPPERFLARLQPLLCAGPLRRHRVDGAQLAPVPAESLELIDRIVPATISWRGRRRGGEEENRQGAGYLGGALRSPEATVRDASESSTSRTESPRRRRTGRPRRSKWSVHRPALLSRRRKPRCP